MTFSGMKRVAASRSCWAMKRLTSSMATAWSTVPRVQASSQRRLQMRPHTAGNGFSRLMSWSASRYSALRGELQVALHGDVRRARRLARGCTGIVAVDAVVVAVVDVPLIRAPGGSVRQLVARVLDGAVLRAELLAELHRARGTRFNTAAARNAVFARPSQRRRCGRGLAC